MRPLSSGARVLILLGVVILVFSSIWAYSDRDKFASQLSAQEVDTAVLVEQYDELRALFELCVQGGQEAQATEVCKNPPAPPSEDLIEDTPPQEVVPIPGPEGDKGDKGDQGEQGPPPSFDVVLGAVRAMCEPLPFACDQPDPDDPETQEEETQDAEEQEGEVQEAEEQEAEVQEEEVQDAEVQETVTSIVLNTDDPHACFFRFTITNSDGTTTTIDTNPFDCQGPPGRDGAVITLGG